MSEKNGNLDLELKLSDGAYRELFTGVPLAAGFVRLTVDPTEVKGVWFNPPHTTVRWGDNATTTVRCGENDVYDPMVGFLLCVAKRHFGNTGRYLEVMRANGVPECPKPTTIEVKVGKADYVCVSTEAWNEVVEA